MVDNEKRKRENPLFLVVCYRAFPFYLPSILAVMFNRAVSKI